MQRVVHSDLVQRERERVSLYRQKTKAALVIQLTWRRYELVYVCMHCDPSIPGVYVCMHGDPSIPGVYVCMHCDPSIPGVYLCRYIRRKRQLKALEAQNRALQVHPPVLV